MMALRCNIMGNIFPITSWSRSLIIVAIRGIAWFVSALILSSQLLSVQASRIRLSVQFLLNESRTGLSLIDLWR
jgi:hypothetical protein